MQESVWERETANKHGSIGPKKMAKNPAIEQLCI